MAGNKNSASFTDDLQSSENLKRVENLEEFRKEYEGKAFEAKVAVAVKESKLVEAEIETVLWNTLKKKIVWIILTAIVIIFFDTLREWAIATALKFIPHS